MDTRTDKAQTAQRTGSGNAPSVNLSKPTNERHEWSSWLHGYTAEKFYDAFMYNAQGAESVCVHCGNNIYLDIREGGGVTDWRTSDGDYGCDQSPETDDDACGGHFPRREQS